jgi:hypothetical protein
MEERWSAVPSFWSLCSPTGPGASARAVEEPGGCGWTVVKAGRQEGPNDFPTAAAGVFF